MRHARSPIVARLSPALALLAVVGTPAAAVPPPSGSDGDPATTERVDAADPTTAAIQLSVAAFFDAAGPTSDEDAALRGAASYALLSRDDEFADSLAGTALAADGPLLLTRTSALPQSTSDELQRVLADGATVYLLGGEQAISGDVESALTGLGYNAERLAGPTRVETAIAIAQTVRALYPDAPNQVGLARANAPANNPTAAWADAVTGGGWAAAERTPILLTQSASLHAEVAEFLTTDEPDRTVLFGGTAALSTAVEQAVPSPLRVSGSERAGTAAAIAVQLRFAEPHAPGAYIIVNGYHAEGWAYGLPAASLSALQGPPILVVDTDRVPDATADLVSGCQTIELLVVGSDAVISPATRQTLDDIDTAACG